MNLRGLSNLELRHLIESAFLPARCKCSCSVTGAPSLTIEIFEEDLVSIALFVTGVDINTLSSSRAISSLIAEIREDLKFNKRQLFSNRA